MGRHLDAAVLLAARLLDPAAPRPARPAGVGGVRVADWLRAIRQDPRLPVGHLPASWPASAAHALFLRRHGEVAPEAARVAAEILRSVPAGVS
ncbi:PaaX family transcriptional regulator C-terminal domain-containing protein [Pseudonocardia oceani]|uniref:PaaX family transcriptional regulator C-terminal domain-containing protein n=1 Tax=Pseudonocardia oceani TaxID=2792013 RepID=UPI003556B782